MRKRFAINVVALAICWFPQLACGQAVGDRWGLKSTPPDAVARGDLKLPPLDEMLFPTRYRHANPNDPQRHVGVGQPLAGTSWRNRPLYASWLYGAMWGDSLISNSIQQSNDDIAGMRLGWDFDHYWGTELRLSIADLSLIDAVNTQHRYTRNNFADLNLLYYPWGDAKWRPFAGIGAGVGDFRFDDQSGTERQELLVTLPVSMGVKYYWQNWTSLRLTVADNIAIGKNGVATMHNMSLTGAVELRFGGRRPTFYPFSGGGYLW